MVSAEKIVVKTRACLLYTSAIVADERIGKDYNLSAERRVRQGFLIAAHACCEDDFTNSRMVPIKGCLLYTSLRANLPRCRSYGDVAALLIHHRKGTLASFQ